MCLKKDTSNKKILIFIQLFTMCIHFQFLHIDYKYAKQPLLLPLLIIIYYSHIQLQIFRIVGILNIFGYRNEILF